MIQKLNYLVTRIFDIILYPFSFIHEFWGFLFLSILMSFVVLYIYKWVSSPGKIVDAKDKIKANILAIRLYKDLWKIIVSSFFKSLYYTFKYFILNFGPVLLIIPILFPSFVQMDVRYGMKPFDTGDQIMVKAKFQHNPNELNVHLEESEFYKPVMNPVFINATLKDEDRDKKQVIREVNWKIEALKPGLTTIRIKVGDQIFEKQLRIGTAPSATAVSNSKYKESSWAHLINPVEKLLPGEGELAQISLHYPRKDINVLGIEWNWIVLNLILIIIVVLAFKNKFGIEF